MTARRLPDATRYTVRERDGAWHPVVRHGTAPPLPLAPHIGLIEACAFVASVWPGAVYLPPDYFDAGEVAA